MTVRGIAFPFGKSATGFPATKDDEDLVEDNIRRILTTRRGERVMRPEVGSDAHDFVFENVGAVLRAAINHEARRAIAANEPRARVLSVVAGQQDRTDGGSEVVVEIVYEVAGLTQRTGVTL